MARKRFVAPSFFVHSALFDLEERTKLPVRLAFAGLWCQSDRRGLFEWKPRELKLAVLPYDPCDFTAVLEALLEAKFIERHVVNGQVIGRIPSFERWQTFHHNERASDLPDPSGFDHTTTDGEPTPPNGGHEPSNGGPESPPSIAVAVTAAAAVAGSVAAEPVSRDKYRPADRPALPAARSHSERLQALRSVAEPHEADALEHMLAKHAKPEQLVSELFAIAKGKQRVRGKNGRLADAGAVMRAVAEMVAKDKEFDTPLFRGFVRRVVDRPAEPLSREEQQAARAAAEQERRALMLLPAERPRTPEEIAAGAETRTQWRSMMLSGDGHPKHIGTLVERALPRVAHA